MQTKLFKKYTCRSDWTVMHCVKNDSPEHHLPTSSSSEIVTVKNFFGNIFAGRGPSHVTTESRWTPIYSSSPGLWWPFCRAEMLSETINLFSGVCRENPWRERLPRSSLALSTKIRARNWISCLAMHRNKHKAITGQGSVKRKGWETPNGKAMLLSKYW